ncbi:MAG: Rpn family recombination-promoting nuclease/putative transposase [Oscillospiraceae bacterium]|jgi:predicted transposase/invertase (TIGR01784 family)|nr:Rpn family recombination-promoting nuclease/putative transposase [Oscillospiraceae bacterium]
MDDYPEILPPREDGVFKRILTHPSGKPVLLSVVSGLLGVNVTEATVLNVEPVLTGIDEKREKFDVNCKTDTGHQMEIEMQAEAMRNDSIANLHKNMLSRSVFNLCDLHKSQPGRGKAYDTLLHSYQATICGYTLLPSRPSYINRVQLRFDDGQLFVEDVGIIFLELTKLEDVLKKPVDEMSLIEAIAVFFAKADDLRYRSMITALGRVREEIGLADELLLTISKDDIERAHYRSRRLFEMDRQSEIALATRVGERQ